MISMRRRQTVDELGIGFDDLHILSGVGFKFCGLDFHFTNLALHLLMETVH